MNNVVCLSFTPTTLPVLAGKVVTVGPFDGADIKADLRFRLPLDDESVDTLVVRFILNRLSYHHSGSYLADYARVLVPGGELFVTVPDLDFAIDSYLSLPAPQCFDIWHELIYGPDSTGMAAYNFNWFAPQFDWIGLAQLILLERTNGRLDMVAKKRLDYKEAPIFVVSNSNYNQLPANMEEALVLFPDGKGFGFPPLE
jgi:SAM-dependent methyltransferase